MQPTIYIPIGPLSLAGFLSIPKKPLGIVLFVHGSGSSRHSPRNNFVAQVLNEAGLATLVIDLLSTEEDSNYEARFDMDLLTNRVTQIVDWMKKNHELKNLSIGLFGASTGAAAALMASTIKSKEIKAIVSRGGRPDLAEHYLSKVTAPTLFIVGSEDFEVLSWNESAYNLLCCAKKLEIVPHATHLFEEPGCLERVSQLAKKWFITHLQLDIKEK